MKRWIQLIAIVSALGPCLVASDVPDSRGEEQVGIDLPAGLSMEFNVKISDPEVLCFITPETKLHYSAQFQQGKGVIDGGFSVLDSSGAPLVRGTYAEGVLNGSLITYHANGAIASMYKYVNGLLEGVGMNLGSRGELRRVSTYRKGQKFGTETYFAEDGTPSMIIEWERQVKSIRLYSSGVLSESHEGLDAKDFLAKKLKEVGSTP